MIIGWIGTGVMGRSMAGHLLSAGHTVRVHNRTRSKADALVVRGATWTATAADAARGADAVCVMVGYPTDVERVILGEGGVLSVMDPDALLIDFTTSSPALAERIAREAGKHGVLALDAPVSGGDLGAREARLSIMAGGTPEAFARAEPLLKPLGTTVVHQGPPGSGQRAKLVNQILIASNMIGVCEALVFALRAGLAPERVLQSVSSGAAASWSLTNLAPRMLKDDLQPGFYVKHFIKDLELALEEARRMHLDLPGLSLARTLYGQLSHMGGDEQGTQALIRAYRESGASGS